MEKVQPYIKGEMREGGDTHRDGEIEHSAVIHAMIDHRFVWHPLGCKRETELIHSCVSEVQHDAWHTVDN